MLEKIMVNVIGWMANNIVALVFGGALLAFTYGNDTTIFAFFAVVTIIMVTGFTYLKKKGYEYGVYSEDEEA